MASFRNLFQIPSFTVINTFIALLIVGICLVFVIPIKLNPSGSTNTINISFDWPRTNAENIENEVTSKIESLLSTISGIREITSQSRENHGTITALLDPQVIPEQVKYEISNLIQHVYATFPKNVSYPQVQISRPYETSTIMSYTLAGNSDNESIHLIAEQFLKRNLLKISGIEQINTLGETPNIWTLHYNSSRLARFKVRIDDLMTAIDIFFKKKEAGKVIVINRDSIRSYVYLTMQVDHKKDFDWKNIKITTLNGRNVYLKDLAAVQYAPPHSNYTIYHYNGFNAIKLNIVAKNSANYLTLSKEIKKIISSIKRNLPAGYYLTESYDSSSVLRSEIIQICTRFVFTLITLFCMVYIISRRLIYIYLISISLICNVFIAVIFYYILKIEINLYSLIALSVALGLIVDNSIVVIEHIRTKKNLKILPAICGGTFTSIGMICIIFFLKENIQVKLRDFALIIIINLVVSLLISLFLIPALISKLSLGNPDSDQSPWPSQRKFRAIGNYNKYIRFSKKHSGYYTGFLILLLGTPVFLLPERIDSQNRAAQVYNSTLGSDFYVRHVKKITDILLGGSLRLFWEKKKQSAGNGPENLKKILKIDITMPYGAKLGQIINIVEDFENYLAHIKELKEFVTVIYDKQHASIEVTLPDKSDDYNFRNKLKSGLQTKAILTGMADFNIYGIGRGFDNKLDLQNTNYAIALFGYNYKKLMNFAEVLQNDLKRNARVTRIKIGADLSDGSSTDDQKMELSVKDREQMIFRHLSILDFSQVLQRIGEENPLQTNVNIQNHRTRLFAVDDDQTPDVWELMNSPVPTDSASLIRLGQFVSIEKAPYPEIISRKNQQYHFVVNYNFVGDDYLGDNLIKQETRYINNQMPLGYQATGALSEFDGEKSNDLLWAILGTILIVFVISSIILNDLFQALMIVVLIPITYIGVFLSVYLFNYEFDEGGYAGMIVLCGITVNFAMYILNDFNFYKQKRKFANEYKFYAKALFSKITVILMSSVSMVASLIPFIFFSPHTFFWSALAFSISSGLFFLLLAIFIYLPLFLLKRSVKPSATSIQYHDQIFN